MDSGFFVCTMESYLKTFGFGIIAGGIFVIILALALTYLNNKSEKGNKDG